MGTKGRILLHTCCGVCASHCVRVLKEEGWEPLLFFFNPNIHPHAEYLRRREAAQALARAEVVPLVEDAPDHAAWREAVAEGFEACPEGGARCARCFRFSLARAAARMGELGCAAFTTSLTVSPHKRSALIHAIGREVGGAAFAPYDFKKRGGFQDSNRRAAELGLYRQIYCGCEFSARHRDPFAVAILGLGYRGGVYARWALAHPGDLRVAAIAEPDPALRAAWAARLGLGEGQVFADWRDALGVPGLEGAIVALPDRLHFPAAREALARRLHLLLEKPAGATWEECVGLDAAVRASGRLVQVGHILRFTPYYAKIAELVHGGTLGRLVSIQHLEPVGYRKAAHAFCRGPLGRTAASTPMIVQKCSHDFDLFAWWVGAPCLCVQSFGGLRHFRPDCAPPGAATRCLDCPAAIERACPFSAIRLLREGADLRYALPDPSTEGIEAALRGPYGRCVYAGGNDAVDHQTVNLLFANGVTVQHCMESYTWGRDRETRLCLTDGEIVGDARTLTIRRFSDRRAWRWDAALEAGGPTHESSYVLGNDGILRDWVETLRTLPPAHYPARFHASIQAHAMAYAAEASRLAGGRAIPIAAL